MQRLEFPVTRMLIFTSVAKTPHDLLVALEGSEACWAHFCESGGESPGDLRKARSAAALDFIDNSKTYTKKQKLEYHPDTKFYFG